MKSKFNAEYSKKRHVALQFYEPRVQEATVFWLCHKYPNLITVHFGHRIGVRSLPFCCVYMRCVARACVMPLPYVSSCFLCPSVYVFVLLVSLSACVVFRTCSTVCFVPAHRLCEVSQILDGILLKELATSVEVWSTQSCSAHCDLRKKKPNHCSSGHRRHRNTRKHKTSTGTRVIPTGIFAGT